MKRWMKEVLVWVIAIVVLSVAFEPRDVGAAIGTLAIVALVSRVVAQKMGLGIVGAIVLWAAIGGVLVFFQYMGRIEDEAGSRTVALVVAALLALPVALVPVWPLEPKEKRLT